MKLALTMEEVFITLTKHATVFKMRTGVTNDGRIVARDCQVYWDTGAYADIARGLRKNQALPQQAHTIYRT